MGSRGVVCGVGVDWLGCIFCFVVLFGLGVGPGLPGGRLRCCVGIVVVVSCWCGLWSLECAWGVVWYGSLVWGLCWCGGLG